MGRNWNEQERIGRGADDDGVGDQNVVDRDVGNNCDQHGERHDRENDGVVQAPSIMVAIAVAPSSAPLPTHPYSFPFSVIPPQSTPIPSRSWPTILGYSRH